MVEIGGRPILWHIMKIYSALRLQRLRDLPRLQGLRDQGVLRQLLPAHLRRDLRPGNNAIEVHRKRAEPWRVTLVDTGDETHDRRPPEARRATISATSRFCLTYGDGVADVDIAALVAFHRAHGTLATVTAVPPPGRFGALEIDGDGRCSSFRREAAGRRRLDQRRLLRAVAEGAATTSTATPRLGAEPLRTSPRDGQLMAYRHDGFWQPMDTLRDKNLLEELWAAGKAPWKSVVSPIRGFWRGRRVLLTGHTGFKGGWLALWLQRLGAEVDRLAPLPADDAEPVRARGLAPRHRRRPTRDIRDRAGGARRGARHAPEIVLHLAAQPLVARSYREPVETFATNVMGTAHLLEARARRATACRRSSWSPPTSATTTASGPGLSRGRRRSAATIPTAARRLRRAGRRRRTGARFFARSGTRRRRRDRARRQCHRRRRLGRGPAGARLHARRRGGTADRAPQPDAIAAVAARAGPLCGYLLLAERLAPMAERFAEAWNFGPERGGAAGRLGRRAHRRAVGRWRALAARAGDAAPHEAGLAQVDASQARRGSAGRRSRGSMRRWLDRRLVLAAMRDGEAARALLAQSRDRADAPARRLEPTAMSAPSRTCRFCGAALQRSFVDLGRSPLANAF